VLEIKYRMYEAKAQKPPFSNPYFNQSFEDFFASLDADLILIFPVLMSI
jgi:hypothetical protein